MNNPHRRAILAGAFAAGAGAAFSGSSATAFSTYRPRTSFTPGEVWLDTAGKPIQAHGGSIIQVAGSFFWYGENKEHTDGKNGIWHWGVRCYSSKDLYNWEDLGVIIPPEPNDPTSPLYPKKGMDRPHILFNPQTKKFVCWIKVMEDPHQTRSVLVADQITGPYQLVRKGILPLGMNAGDFDLVVSPDDGKAYMYFERVHTELICADLTESWTDFTGYYSTHFPRQHPPFVREGPAYFRRNGKHYLATSGTTGYFPNPSEIAVADTFHGPWTVLGDLHPGDKSRTSFNSQISSIFRHPDKKDLYIALADRWMGPLSGEEFESGELSEVVRRAFGKYFSNPRQALTPEEKAAFTDGYYHVNTSLSRYAWLPIVFDNDRPRIDWRPEWRIEDYD